MQKTWTLLAGLVAAAPTANAGTVTGLSSDFIFSGGGSGGYFYTNNTGGVDNHDDINLSDFLFEINTKDAGDMAKFSATAGAGNFLNINVLNGGVVGAQQSPLNFDLQYAYLTGMFKQGLYAEGGQLHTRIGYESVFSHANPNALLGAMVQAQPTFYPGIRAGFDWNDQVDFFAEVTNDASQGGSNTWAVGVGGDMPAFKYSLIWNNVDDGRSGLDVVASTRMQNMELAVNFDWYTIDSKIQPGTDDSAWGIALYAVPKFWLLSVPVRFEWLHDGDTQTFGPPGSSLDSGWEVTVTPTYYFSDNAFGRVEAAYISADNEVFIDDNGNPKDANWAINAQLGLRF